VAGLVVERPVEVKELLAVAQEIPVHILQLKAMLAAMLHR
jgi:hypothetical protein